MKIYTLTGDDGTTSLAGGKRVPKHSLKVEAYGTVDELIAWMGLLRSHKEIGERKDMILYIQNQLMRIAAAIAWDNENLKTVQTLPDSDSVTVLEKEIDKMERELPLLMNFILPGGNILVSYCHIARCVCRRAERAVIRLNESEKTPEIVNKFLNRLSDFLFVLSRIISLETGNEDVSWFA